MTLEELLRKSEEICFYKKDRHSEATFYIISPKGEECLVTYFERGLHELNMGIYKDSISEVMETIQGLICTDNTFANLFEKMFSSLCDTMFSLVKLVLKDEDLEDLEFKDIVKLEFNVYAFTGAQISFTKERNGVSIERYNIDCSTFELINDSPYVFEGCVSVRNKYVKEEGTHYVKPITPDMYECFDSIFRGTKGIWNAVICVIESINRNTHLLI